MNAIYKVIFNRATGQPVVVSELGKGKLKSSTCKALKTAILMSAALFSMKSNATVCDTTTFSCQLDANWSFATNNNKNGVANISDGNRWDITGVQSWLKGDKSFVQYDNLQTIFNNGYAVYRQGKKVTSLDAAQTKINYSGYDDTITVYDSITQSYKTMRVYSSNAFSEQDSYKIGYSPSFMVENASVYVDTRLVDVSSGEVNVNLTGATYTTGEIRNSSLVNVDGTQNSSVANWNSKQQFITTATVDWSTASSSADFNVISDKYKGSFEAFDGSTHIVNNINDFKTYNNWLVQQLKAGSLAPDEYTNRLKDAYIRNEEIYQYSQFPDNSDSNAYGEAKGGIIKVYGNSGLATISKTGKIEAVTGSVDNFSVLWLTDKGTAINEGEIISSGRIAEVSTGAKLTNNGLLSLGGGNIYLYNSGSFSLRPIYVSDIGSKFLNNATYNINARYAYLSKETNGTIYGVHLVNGAESVNDGQINSGYWGGGTISKEFSGMIRSVVVESNASFINGSKGEVTLGVGSDGLTQSYLGSGSAAIQANTDGKAYNDGTITLNSGSDGVYGFLANGTNIEMINTGTINVNSDGDSGQFIPGQSVGILSQNLSDGTIDNRGTINLNGANNVGIKAVRGGQAASSGVININIAAGQSTLRNYGAWVDGAGSNIGIAGDINLNGDGAIGVHARDGGVINLSGNAAINFSSGTKQIGYFIYGSGSQINNSSSSVQNVSSDNSTLMRLDGGANFTGSAIQGSSMVSSGKNSVVLSATGTGTSVNTGSLTLDLLGTGSTGVLIEGGATGVIDANTALQLNNASAIAAIADGNGYDLTGALTTTGDSSTKLNSAAALSSTQNTVTGYIARNGATLENSGSISFDGENTIGIEVLDGSAGTNSGSITLNDGGVGLKASSSNLITTVNNTGDLTLKGGADDNRTTGNRQRCRGGCR
ncbi:ESPR-type extended signal peptide-containing protein [Enterobacter kobei]|uniref:ESPR domain-containing protein n=1 Tax=Enterobacter TaxID=547 RepID=UPI001E3EC0D1|nr:ESPR domain-containing protein [Enterobacter kobei]MCD2482799.1 hypothetical protein [Enterobacter kobei]MCD2510066.1 hypothetical protein [Enterobacter kobei]HCR1052269.1 hypothetical protein [Enterobacter kobei]